MKKLVAIAVGLAFLAGLSVQAAAAKGNRTPLSAEAKALRKESFEKYDTDKSKTFDAAEIAKISAEDKEKYEKAGVMPKAKATGKGKKAK